MKEFYDSAYFNRFKKNNLIQRLLIRYVDRKEPVLTYLKKHKQKKSTLLDIGCGNGRFLQYVYLYYDCVGLDFSTSAIKQARKIAPSAKLICESANDVGKLNAQFDIITCFDLIEHLPDYSIMLQGIHKLLKPDGIFVFSAPNGGSIGRRLKKEDWYGFRDPSHVWYHTQEQWQKIIEKAGFRQIKTYVNGLMDPPYIKWLPLSIQNFCIKYPTQGLSLLGVSLPKTWGEIFFMILRKV